MTTGSDILHASAVAVAHKGCLILGPSGSGKSTLALQLISLGAGLVADDRVAVAAQGQHVRLSAPKGLPPALEARGVGLLSAALVEPVDLHLVVDLSIVETKRLPPRHVHQVCGIDVPCLHKVEMAHFPFAVHHYLMHGPADL